MNLQRRTVHTLRVLDFDIEARPLSWYGGDWVSKEVTAIAAQFVGEPAAHCWLLGETDTVDMLTGFRELYDQADMVTGHYIRGYDLPVINAAMVEFDLPPLEPKLTQDTKLDLLKMQGLSKSQEALGAMLGLAQPKVQMTQSDWREANRLTERGLALVRDRVLGDVRQHIAMRAELNKRGLLRPPSVWRPAADRKAR